MIYLIDDDVSVRRSLERLLASAKLPAVGFASGEEFLAAIRPTEADCLVVDVHGSGMTGTELQQRLQQTGVRTPVIFTTGFDDETTRIKARQAGAAGFFLKPVDGQALLDAIHFALKTGPE